MLLTESNLFRTDDTEQASRPYDQHRNENQEPDGVLERRVEIVAGKRLDQADDEAADEGAPDAAEAAKDHDGKGREDEVAADLWDMV